MPDPITFVQKTWVDVPDEDNPPLGAPATGAGEFNRIEDGIADTVEHANTLYTAHGGMVYYTGESTAPPPNPPTDLLWIKSDTGDFVRNTGTSLAPSWSPVQTDDTKLTANDFLSDYIVTGLLPPLPANSLVLSVPGGRAYINGHLTLKGAAYHTVPESKRTLVDLSDAGVFSNVDYGVIIDDAEDVWAEKTDVNFTQSIVPGPDITDNALRLSISAAAQQGHHVTEAIPATDLSPYSRLRITLRSSVALAADRLAIMLDNTAQCVSPVHTLYIPALAANTWTTVEIPYTPTTGTNAIISVGLKYMVDYGAGDVDIASVWAVKASRPPVTANSIRLFEAAADANIRQQATVGVTTATNSTDYTVQLNTLDIVYTSDSTATRGEIALGLVAAINASTNPLVKATASTTAIATDTAAATITLTAKIPGIAFNAAVGNNLSLTHTVPNSLATLISVTDLRDTTPSVRGTIGHVINSSGAALPQRRTLEVSGSLFALDDAANDKTLIQFSGAANARNLNLSNATPAQVLTATTALYFSKRFTPTVPGLYAIGGVVRNTVASASYTVRLRVASDLTTVATVTITGNGAPMRYTFDNPIALNPGTEYEFAYSSTAVANLRYSSTDNSSTTPDFVMGVNFTSTQQDGATSRTQTTGAVPNARLDYTEA